MIAVFIVLALFIGISIYFFFRAEKLQRLLTAQKREVYQSRKDAKLLSDSMILVASKYEEFAKFRLQALKNKLHDAEEPESPQLELLTPLVNNYAAIYRACLSAKEQLKPATKKCYDSYRADAFGKFITLIQKKEKHVQRMWSSNNLNGFISLIEALIIEQEMKMAKKEDTQVIS